MDRDVYVQRYLTPTGNKIVSRLHLTQLAKVMAAKASGGDVLTRNPFTKKPHQPRAKRLMGRNQAVSR